MKQVLKKLLDAGFWLGISVIIEPLFAVFFILIYVGIFLHQKITIQTILSPIIGFLTPLILYFTYCFWFDLTEDFFKLFYLDVLDSSLINVDNSSNWFLGFILFLTLVSLFIKSPKALSVNNSFKKNWGLLILNLILSLFFVLIAKEKNSSEVVYLLFPTSIIIANGLEIIHNKLIKNIVFISILVAVVLSTFL
jgi:hypothetical protein